MGKKDLKKQPNVSVCIYAIGLKQTCLNILVAVNILRTNIQYNVKKIEPIYILNKHLGYISHSLMHYFKKLK